MSKKEKGKNDKGDIDGSGAKGKDRQGFPDSIVIWDLKPNGRCEMDRRRRKDSLLKLRDAGRARSRPGIRML